MKQHHAEAHIRYHRPRNYRPVGQFRHYSYRDEGEPNARQVAIRSFSTPPDHTNPIPLIHIDGELELPQENTQLEQFAHQLLLPPAILDQVRIIQTHAPRPPCGIS